MSHSQGELDLRDLDFLCDQQAATLMGGTALNTTIGCYYPKPPREKCFPEFKKHDDCKPKYCWEPPVWTPKC